MREGPGVPFAPLQRTPPTSETSLWPKSGGGMRKPPYSDIEFIDHVMGQYVMIMNPFEKNIISL